MELKEKNDKWLRYAVDFPVARPTKYKEHNTAFGDYYQPTEDWTTYLYAWAEVDSGPSRKFWAARQLHAEATHVITIRWREDFNPTRVVRFKWTDRGGYTHTAYPLGPAVNQDANRNRFLEFVVAENVEDIA